MNPGVHQTSGWGGIFETVFNSALVLFYEAHRPWWQDDACLGREQAKWPGWLRFSWVMRNAATHHRGKINFPNPLVLPVSWGGLTYSPKDNGKQALGSDLSNGDVLMLLLDMSDELDRLGAPHL